MIDLSNCPTTGKMMKLVARTIEFDLKESYPELRINYQIVYFYDENTTMADWIASQPFTRTQKAEYIRQFASSVKSVSTRGNMVDAQGNRVDVINVGTEEEPIYQFPQGSMKEGEYWKQATGNLYDRILTVTDQTLNKLKNDGVV